MRPAAAAGRSTSPPGWTGGSAQGETPPGFGLKTKPSKKGPISQSVFYDHKFKITMKNANFCQLKMAT